nr:cytochrome P450 CYP749A22-like isoform X2 [Ziziphus jujuba var. spinosa]
MQYLMGLQGIKGPSYKFIHGNTKQMYPTTYFLKCSLILNPGSKYMNYLQWYGTVAQLVVTESELIKEILSNKDGAFPKFETQPLVKKLLGDGLVNNEGEMWAKLRRLANHAFHGESLKQVL